MTERRYWYLAAVLLLAAGALFIWFGPLSGFVCPKKASPIGYVCGAGYGIIIAPAALLGALLLAVIGTIRDPP